MANFFFGQAKLAILKSFNAKNEGQDIDMISKFKPPVDTGRVVQYQQAESAAHFREKRCVREGVSAGEID